LSVWGWFCLGRVEFTCCSKSLTATATAKAGSCSRSRPISPISPPRPPPVPPVPVLSRLLQSFVSSARYSAPPVPPTSSIRFTSCFPLCFCSASTAKSAPFTLCVSLSLFIAPGPIPLRLFVIHSFIHPIHLKIAPRRAFSEFHSLCSQRSTGLERHSLTTSTQPTPPGSTS
jgi:hypothetical protein